MEDRGIPWVAAGRDKPYVLSQAATAVTGAPSPFQLIVTLPSRGRDTRKGSRKHFLLVEPFPFPLLSVDPVRVW